MLRATGDLSDRSVPYLSIGLALTAAYVIAVLWAMAHGDYSLWMALLLAPLLVVITLPALRRQAKREHDERLFRLLCWALALKLLASLVRYYVVFGLYGGSADAGVYHLSGIDISANFRSLVFDTGLPNLHDTEFIRFLTGILYTLIGPTLLGGFLVFSWLAFWGLFLLYRSFVIAVPEGRSHTYARLLFFFPSMLFWPSSIGKEAWMVLALGITLFGLSRFLTDNARRAVVPLVVGAWMMTIVRPHVAAMVGVGIVAAYLIKPTYQRRSREIAPLVKAAILIPLILGSVLLVQRSQEFLGESGVKGKGVTDTLQETSYRTQLGGSGFAPAILNSPERAPIAFITVLFRPLLPEARNAQAALASLEGTVLLLWSIWRWPWIVASVRSMRRQPYVAMALAFVGVFVFAFSSIGNFGILARQRVQMLPFFFVLLAIPPREGGEDVERRPTVALQQVG